MFQSTLGTNNTKIVNEIKVSDIIDGDIKEYVLFCFIAYS